MDWEVGLPTFGCARLVTGTRISPDLRPFVYTGLEFRHSMLPATDTQWTLPVRVEVGVLSFSNWGYEHKKEARRWSEQPGSGFFSHNTERLVAI